MSARVKATRGHVHLKEDLGRRQTLSVCVHGFLPPPHSIESLKSNTIKFKIPFWGSLPYLLA